MSGVRNLAPPSAAELRGLGIDELGTMLLDLRKEQFNLRFRKAVGDLQDTSQIRKVKTSIARLKTVRSELMREEGHSRGRAGGPGNARTRAVGHVRTARPTVERSHPEAKAKLPVGRGAIRDGVALQAGTPPSEGGAGKLPTWLSGAGASVGGDASIAADYAGSATKAVDRQDPQWLSAGQFGNGDEAREVQVLIGAQFALRSPRPDERLAAVCTMADALGRLRRGPVKGVRLSNAARRLPAGLHRALLDADERVGWVAARALFADPPRSGDGATSPTKPEGAELRMLLDRVESYVCEQRIGVITEIDARTRSAPLDGRVLAPVEIEIAVEVGDRLSIGENGSVLRTIRPGWLRELPELEFDVTVVAGSWHARSEEAGTPLRGMARRVVSGLADTGPPGMLHVDIYLDRRQLPRRSLLLSELPSLHVTAAKD